MTVFSYRSTLQAPASAVFDWHKRPGALERLLPPWNSARVIERNGGLEVGSSAVLRLGRPPMQWRWVASIRDCDPGHGFTDEQLEGPFAHWVHSHRFHDESDARCTIEDEIDYRLPYGPIGRLATGPVVASTLERTFRFRHKRTADDLGRHLSLDNGRKTRFAVSGASGLVGGELVNFLRSGGHEVRRLVRRKPRDEQGEVFWDPRNNRLDPRDLEGVDVVVHLAGENISSSRWTNERKHIIVDSRVSATRLISEALASMDDPPKTLVAASAIGYYGNRGADLLDEDSEHGAGFLSNTCRAWEAATEAATAAGIRVVNLRIGVVLSARAGALARMLIPFRLGAGGVIGNGRQFLSWIAIDDLVGVIHFVAHNSGLRGPVNAVAPTAVTNRGFTKALGRVLKRPTLLPLPAPAVRLAFGEMGEELLIAGCRVLPAKLEQAGFAFLYPQIAQALAVELGRV